ncbi:MAG: DUF4489 domain-containing protein [Lacrimispora sp.]|uniref:DUF4489 domain-containing protein n=1 Tax=Lacrimispora sp. TaxID=2719234 RepID=UPI0039E56D21
MNHCLFGMPYPRNVPYRNTFNRTHHPVPARQFDQKLMVQSLPESLEVVSAPNKMMLKGSSSGGIFLPENTDKNAVYTVASINLDTSEYKNFIMHFNFSCSVAATGARLHLKFQLFKQEKNQTNPFPVGSGFIFTRNEESTETNPFSLTAWDLDSMTSECCNYSIRIEVMGFDTVGTVMITNPVLAAFIIENEQ